jgi:hypothetical protein
VADDAAARSFPDTGGADDDVLFGSLRAISQSLGYVETRKRRPRNERHHTDFTAGDADRQCRPHRMRL